MNRYVISEDIYNESMALSKDYYKISEEIADEADSLNIENLKQELTDSYKFSGRYWIWRMSAYAYKHYWNSMFADGEMCMNAPGIKYFNSYPTLAALEMAYKSLHPDNKGVMANPAAYYAFANYLKKGDVVIVYNSTSGIFGWGIIEGNYFYRLTRNYFRHYRKVAWHKINMPFIFSRKIECLYQIPKEETHNLKQALVNNFSKTINRRVFPFGFVAHYTETSFQFKAPEDNENQKKALGEILRSLLDSY